MKTIAAIDERACETTTLFTQAAPVPYTMNTITAIEDVVSDHWQRKMSGRNMRMLIARIYKPWVAKTWPEYALHSGRNNRKNSVCYSVDKSAGPREVAVMGQVAALYSGRNPKVRL